MKFIADLHIHSKFARATSPAMEIPYIAQWARLKGVRVIATGDFTHPQWFEHLKQSLIPAEPGLFVWNKDPERETGNATRFMLTVETSHIYSKNGKGHRVHLLVFAPSFETVEKINTQLSWIGNIKSDGRPILGLDAKEMVKIVLNIDSSCMVVPAHCLLPDTVIHTKDDLLKPIQHIHKGDFVITHKNTWRRVIEVFKRPYNGKVYRIKPRNFSLGLTTTSEHPFYAIKTRKNCHWSNGICKPPHINLDRCKNKYFRNYKPEWIPAEKLEKGDVLIYPRFLNIFQNHQEIDLKEITKEVGLEVNSSQGFIAPIGNKITQIKQFISIDKNFCKLAGYYLAEGYTNSRDLISFAFSNKEKNYIEEVIDLMKKVFGFDKEPKLKTNRSGGIEILFCSKILYETFSQLFYSSNTVQNASTKSLPAWALGLPLDLQVELFKCWWRGDAGYTASRLLMNQMKIILLRLGIVPSIYVDTRDSYNSRPKHFIQGRKINARYDMYSLNRLSFYEDKFNLLKEPEFAKVAKYNKGNKHGWIDDNYIYLPIYDIEIKNYRGEVYNLEVEEDNSYVCEFATVHNCWTPWFSVFGSMSGFDSLQECFDEYASQIFAIETGISSDPLMNWRLSQLDNLALISNSDSHSVQRIGREANVFDTELSYAGIIDAIKSRDPKKFLYTIEFYPEGGRYHFDGHRLCNISFSPEQTKAHGGKCPVCGKSLVLGTLYRVEQLADRPEGFILPNAIPFRNAMPLDEVIAQSFGVTTKTKKVMDAYIDLCKTFGGEINVLLDADASEIARHGYDVVAQGITRMRQEKVEKIAGYDGEYGVIKLFSDEDRANIGMQKSLF